MYGQLLGCMAVTSLVDISPLQQNFNLHVYDQLVQPDLYEAAISAHGQQAAAEVAGKWPTHFGILYPPPTPLWCPSKKALHLLHDLASSCHDTFNAHTYNTHYCASCKSSSKAVQA